MMLKDMPMGTIVHNIELRPGQGGKLARSAGAYAQLTARDGKYAILKMPSGETRMVLSTCVATVGTVSNAEHNKETLGKAGRNRWRGIRPRVRGVAMNRLIIRWVVAKAVLRRTSRSRKGLLAKGRKTRKPKNQSNKHIIERRKK